MIYLTLDVFREVLLEHIRNTAENKLISQKCAAQLYSKSIRDLMKLLQPEIANKYRLYMLDEMDRKVREMSQKDLETVGQN